MRGRGPASHSDLYELDLPRFDPRAESPDMGEKHVHEKGFFERALGIECPDCSPPAQGETEGSEGQQAPETPVGSAEPAAAAPKQPGALSRKIDALSARFDAWISGKPAPGAAQPGGGEAGSGGSGAGPKGPAEGAGGATA